MIYCIRGLRVLYNQPPQKVSNVSPLSLTIMVLYHLDCIQASFNFDKTVELVLDLFYFCVYINKNVLIMGLMFILIRILYLICFFIEKFSTHQVFEENVSIKTGCLYC